MKKGVSNVMISGVMLLTALFAGCGNNSNRQCSSALNVTVQPDICKKSVEVHLVGVSKSEKDSWDLVPMTKYWEYGNKLRNSAKDYTKVIKFGGDEPCKKVLCKNDEFLKIWKKKKSEYLFIMANLPGVFDDMDKSADARRLRIPALNSKCWKFGHPAIEISINSGNIACYTEHKCE